MAAIGPGHSIRCTGSPPSAQDRAFARAADESLAQSGPATPGARGTALEVPDPLKPYHEERHAPLVEAVTGSIW